MFSRVLVGILLFCSVNVTLRKLSGGKKWANRGVVCYIYVLLGMPREKIFFRFCVISSGLIAMPELRRERSVSWCYGFVLWRGFKDVR